MSTVLCGHTYLFIKETESINSVRTFAFIIIFLRHLYASYVKCLIYCKLTTN